jgi:hypothetical protein
MARKSSTRRERKGNKLPWEYCRCGCKGHCVVIGSRSFWMLNDLTGGFHLVEGHGPLLGTRLGVHKSFDAADKAVRKHAKPEFKRLQQEVKKLESAFGS